MARCVSPLAAIEGERRSFGSEREQAARETDADFSIQLQNLSVPTVEKAAISESRMHSGQAVEVTHEAVDRSSRCGPWLLATPTRSLYGNNWSCRIKAPQVRRIAGDDWFLPLPREDHHRRVDDIRGVAGAAEFSAGTSKLRVKRNNLNFLAPQESP